MPVEADVRALLDLSGRFSSAEVFEGYAIDDKNVPENLLIVESPRVIYSFSKSDIIKEQSGGSEQNEVGGRRVRVWVRRGAQAFRIVPFSVGEPPSSFTVGMEHGSPSPSLVVPEMPDAAAAGINSAQEAMEHVAPPQPPSQENIPWMPAAAPEAWHPEQAWPALSSVGANWRNSCAGGDRFSNNCAHFLSDAFIRAGYTELTNYGARCYTPSQRPIRAREMWAWFESKAVRRSNTIQRNTGWWAIFQLDESAYWGGHVVLMDTNTWVYYGTGFYPQWRQYLYQW